MLFAVVGLIVGILAGLFNAAGPRREPGRAVSDHSIEESTTTSGQALPDRFYTVVLASIRRSTDRSVAEARAEKLRTEGVEDVGVLDPRRYSTLDEDFWAVYSGVFDTQRAAAHHRDELRASFPDLDGAYLKLVSGRS